ncbi:MAG: OmpA family protein [Thermaurantiacus sp.]
MKTVRTITIAIAAAGLVAACATNPETGQREMSRARAELRPEFRPSLQALAESLRDYPSTFVDVMGHTDNVGSAAVNQRLSEERAQTVANALGAFGVQQARIATRGYGFTLPVASNDTEAGRAQNRRVEIRLVPFTEQDLASR